MILKSVFPYTKRVAVLALLASTGLAGCMSSGGPNVTQALTPQTDDVTVASVAYTDRPVAFAYADNPYPAEAAQNAIEQRIAVLDSQIDHGQCAGGWGPKPDKLDAVRVTPGHPYYIEIRMRNTPPLPIGHTYTAYGRLGPNGEILNERLTMLAPYGGYAGAAAAGAVPMPANTNPSKIDCRVKPKAAYRVSLTAAQYENLLKEIKRVKAEKPKYHLFVNNCNHYTSRISEAVGIKAPRNKYTSSLVYMYDIMRENDPGYRS